MISKEVLKVSKEISKFGANHVTVPIFASIVFFTIKDMQCTRYPYVLYAKRKSLCSKGVRNS